MDPRFNSDLDSPGAFSEDIDGNKRILGRLVYEPSEGIKIELVENPKGNEYFAASPKSPDVKVLYGQLANGTVVTLWDCFISQAAFQLADGIGAPTTVVASRALFGAHVTNLNRLVVRSYTFELSSLSNWTCQNVVTQDFADNRNPRLGVDLICRPPAPIKIELPTSPFDLEIAHGYSWHRQSGEASISWEACVTIDAREKLSLSEMNEIAWQTQNLFLLLIGHPIGVRSVRISCPPQDLLPEPV